MTQPRHEAVLTALELAPAEGMTLEDIAELCGYPAASCSSAIRELRRPDSGGFHILSLPPSGDVTPRSWRYRMESAAQCST